MTIEELISLLSSTLVLHTTTTQQAYDTLNTKDDNVIYFITDTGLIYKGSDPVIGVRDVSATIENTDTSADPSLATLYYEITLYKSGSIGGNVQFTCPTTDALAAIKTALESSILGVQSSLNTHISTEASDETLAHVKLSDAIDSELDAETGGTAATPKAVKTAIDNVMVEVNEIAGAVSNAMILKGTLSSTSPLPTVDYKAGWTYIVVEAGTYAGHVCEIGDKVMAIRDYVAATASNDDWEAFQTNIDGAVTSDDQLTDGKVIVGDAGHNVKALDNGGSKQVLTIDPNTLKPVWADNIAQGVENPATLTSSIKISESGWYNVLAAPYGMIGTLMMAHSYYNGGVILDFKLGYLTAKPVFKCFRYQPTFTNKIRFRQTGSICYLDMYITNTTTFNFRVDVNNYFSSVIMPYTFIPEDADLSAYNIFEYDLVEGVQSNLPYVSTKGLVAPTLGNGERTMDVDDIIARDSINAIPAGLNSITQLRTGDSTYPYANIDAISPLAITFNNTEVYGLSIAKSASASYTYNGVEYSVTNPISYYAVSVFLVQDTDNMFLKGTAYPFNVCSIAKSNVSVGAGRILAVREIVEGIYELIVNQQDTTIIGYPSAPTLRIFKKSNSTWGLNGTSSVASGANSIANGDRSVASGSYSVASGGDSVASGYYSVASGRFSVASGYSSVASGSYSVASGGSSVASGNYSVASGYSSVASGDYSVASGYSSVASGDYSVASGHSSVASSNYSKAMGNRSIASGVHSVALGNTSTASGNSAMSFGVESVASGTCSVAFNLGTQATGTSQTVVGQYNATDDDAYFIVGNGTSDTDRSNAMIVSKTGVVTANKFVGDFTGTAVNVSHPLQIIDSTGTREYDGSETQTIKLNDYLLLAGGTMEGDIDMGGNEFKNTNLELVENLPTENLYEGRQVTYDGKIYTYHNEKWRSTADDLGELIEILPSEFMYRPIAGTHSVKEGFASVKSIKGNSIIYRFAFLNLNADSLKIVGFNQWDEEWEVGTLDGTNGQSSSATNAIRSKNFNDCLPNTTYYINSRIAFFIYDEDKRFITYSTDTTYTTPSKAAFFKITTRDAANYGTIYNNDICVNLSHNGERDGEYQPYEERIFNLPIKKYFPDGFKSVEDAYDEIVFDKNIGKYKAIQRIGTVDMGTLTWSYHNIFEGFVSMEGFPSATGDNHIFKGLTIRYPYVGYYPYVEDKEMGYHGSSIFIKDSFYTDINSFKQALGGRILYYELAKPIETIIDDYDLIAYKVDDWGTELVLSEESTTIFKADIEYNFDSNELIKYSYFKIADFRNNYIHKDDVVDVITNDTATEYIPNVGAVNNAIVDALTEVLNIMVWQTIGEG